MAKEKKKFDIEKAIKDLQGTFAGDNESQMKGVNILRGVATSDEASANKFMKTLSVAVDNISKSVTKGPEDKKKKESFLDSDISAKEFLNK